MTNKTFVEIGSDDGINSYSAIFFSILDGEGFNFIYVKNGIKDDKIPEVSVEPVLKHPSVKEGCKLFEPIKDWEYIEG